MNFCAYDYGGYGLHPVRDPSEAGCFSDIETAYSFLIAERGVDPSRVILYRFIRVVPSVSDHERRRSP